MDTIEELPLIGGSAALDLVNTAQRGIRLPGVGDHDYLQTPRDLVVWSGRVGLVTPAEARRARRAYDRSPADAEQALANARLIREAMYDALLALLSDRIDQDAVRPVLELLHHYWLTALESSTLDLSQPTADDTPDPALDRRLRVGGDAARLIVDRIAVAAVEALRDIDLQKLRQCPVAEGGCGWVFADRSRNGSRRWCRMEDCGAQVKSRRLTERRRQRTTH
jgi:predicted RNA-binding Zn ribbon-like protein